MDNNAKSTTAGVETKNIGSEITAFVNLVGMIRKGFERRWYDNNFFDDGYHFRYISRTTGRIVDQNERNTSSGPTRAIPKASRQLRGIANLLLGPEFIPAVYPEKIAKANYPDIQQPDPETGQMTKVPNPKYQAALDEAKNKAQKIGNWLTKEWDNQELMDKLTLMLILAGKNSVSYIQVWRDAVEEKVRTQTYDAFDISCIGTLTDLEDSPMVVKSVPMLISKIKANENFDKEQLLKISPDNKYASSEVKEAYMKARYGTGTPSDSSATLILREAYIKEYLDNDNAIKCAKDIGTDFKKYKKGDVVIRQVFTAGDVWLYDKYTSLKKYPFVAYTFEPGPLYQVPMIERFIPANKSLDIIMSRIESFSNTMGVGVYMKRKGENFQISNKMGAQVIEYEGTRPEQMNLVGMPESIFRFAEKLENNIEEQGASTSSLNQLPSGVKSGVAIESLKSTEYANLKIASNQLRKTVKRISERMVEIAGNNFITPQQVETMKDGEPDYFDVQGKKGAEAYKEANVEIPEGTIIIDPEQSLDIQIESGLGFTEQGRKDTMQQIIGFVTPLAEKGLLTTDALKLMITKFLDVYSFGSTQEFMDAMESGTQTAQLTEDQIEQIKVAVLEVLNDAEVVGPKADDKLVDSTKLGTLEALKDTGMLDSMNQQEKAPEAPKGPSESISFKDLPPEGKAQMAAKAGIQLDAATIEADEQESKQMDMALKEKQLKQPVKAKIS